MADDRINADKKKPQVVELFKARKKAPRRVRGPQVYASAGNLALAPAAAPKARPVAFPTPARWFSEQNGAIGFRLYDVVYVFARARRGLPAEAALEWGARYFAGALSEQHGRNVLAVLSPGQEEEAEAGELTEAILQGFRSAITQGAGRLLERPHLQPEDVTVPDAERLIEILEDLYDRKGWLLPVLPFALHMILRKMDLDV